MAVFLHVISFFWFCIIYGMRYCTALSFHCQSTNSISNMTIAQENGKSFFIVLQKAKQTIDIACQSDDVLPADVTNSIFVKLNISRNDRYLASVNFSNVASEFKFKHNISIPPRVFLGGDTVSSATPADDGDATFDFPQYNFVIYYEEENKKTSSTQNNIITVIQVLILPSVLYSFILDEGDQQQALDYNSLLMMQTSSSPCNQLLSYQVEAMIKDSKSKYRTYDSRKIASPPPKKRSLFEWFKR